MAQIVLVQFLPADNDCSYEMCPYGYRHALIKREGKGVGSLVRLHLAEAPHLDGYTVKDIGTDGSLVCFAAGKYTTGGNARSLGGSLLWIMVILLIEACGPCISATGLCICRDALWAAEQDCSMHCCKRTGRN